MIRGGRWRWCAALFASSLVVLTTPSCASASDDVATGQWYASFLNLDAAQQLATGDGERVALIDTGVDYTHPALMGSIDPGANFAAERDDHGLSDSDGHGTSLAGLIVGHGRIRGVAPRARVVSVPNGTVSGLPGPNVTAQAIEWVIAHGIKIVCIASSVSPDPIMEQTIRHAMGADVVIVAAVGNESAKAGVVYPASAPGVLAVGGTDRGGKLSSISATGPDVGIVAPSDHISVARPHNAYAVTTGTSNSSAIVAGAVALIRGKYPRLSAQQVISALTSTAIDEGQPGRDFDYGFGRIDIVAALKKAGTMQPQASPQPSTSAPTSTSVTVTATSPDPKPGLSTPLLVVIIAAGLLAAAVIVVLVVGLARRR
ncbi:S8 family peptidase [Hamadaea tsunoensis]|uniref:S8 family peptidase n=1 Tax=Hamadaea tsunoensis TaxID=53368 RepID=UPI0009FCAB0D|nr:S8 family serine peptidase [Hamadaea tsunoensis]